MGRTLAAWAIWVPALALAFLGWSRRCVVDDTFIDLRVVDSLLQGHGPLFNLAERVEAYSNPLWVGLLAAAGALVKPFAEGQVPLEWISVVFGILCAALGLGCAGLAAHRLAETVTPSRKVVPFGSLAIVALAPCWDFSSCGLETGLSFFWLGSSFLGLSHLVVPGFPRRRTVAVAVLLGLGSLVHPDLGIFSAVFLGCEFALVRAQDRVGVLIAALAIPLSYQIFRMGYFAALVPNTAIAKEAAVSYWSAGRLYLLDFVRPYGLWFPITVLGLGWCVLVAVCWQRKAHRVAAILSTPVLAGLLHGLYVVRVGGDFMHARFLLPTLFALALPVMVVSLGRPMSWLVLAMVPWTLLSSIWLRNFPTAHDRGVPLISDEREVFLRRSAQPHPVTVGDFVPGHPWAVDGIHLATLQSGEAQTRGQGHGIFSIGENSTSEAAFRRGLLANVVAYRLPVGIIGYSAGLGVHVCDAQGLGDAFAARMRLESHGDRLGHEKVLGPEWCIARFLDGPWFKNRSAVEDARRALRCGDLRILEEAISEPLTLRRFLTNLTLSWRLTFLRFPREPASAVAEFCQEGRPLLTQR